jgi:hypothetical protein
MGGGGGVIGAIVGAAVAVVGVVTGQPELVMMGVCMMASSVVSALTAPKAPNSNGSSSSAQLNTGSAVQIQPATNNKLPVVYGTSYTGGAIVDLSISSDNQQLYYVLALSEVTGNGTDNITVGRILYGGKVVTLSGTAVTALTDPSTGLVDTSINGYLNIYLYSNGSYNGLNTSQSAISVMQASGLTYQWDNTKLMTNTVFAIVHLSYNQSANVTSIQQTQFEVINPRNNAGDVIYDYMTSSVYGGAVPASQIDTDSLSALTTYCNQTITFNDYLGNPQTQPRFKFNGTIDTSQNILTNLQDMTSCCDCLLKYNEIYGKWGVIVQSPSYTAVMDINDSNIISAIQITSLDISNTYNIADCQYPDLTLNSAFNSTTINLAEVDPTILYPNEPQNSQTIKLPLVNNNVQAQLLATRFLKAARMDLQVLCTVSYIGLELEAGDVVTITNANYGWSAKLFRILQVKQNFMPDGMISVDLMLQTYDPSVYSDTSINQYKPPPNTGLSVPNIFGTIPAPVISNLQTTAAIPSLQVNITTSSAGITQYAEVWYSAYATPTSSQLIFAGTSQIQPNGNPYGTSAVIPYVTLSNVPAGNWYFFTRMVNSIATSPYSSASSVVNWRPATFQYVNRYLSVAYADSITGSGFTFNPTGKSYYGLINENSAVVDYVASDYTWYLGNPTFGSSNHLLYSNRGNRKFSFATGSANYAAGSASYVPSDTFTYDPSLWAALPNGTNLIDLDQRTGQLIQTGTTTVGNGQISINNNDQGLVVASLAQLLDFGTGVYTKTASAATITVDIYGRVVGFSPPDVFDYSMTAYTASSGQTVFSVTRGSGYIVGQCLVFENGLLLDTSEYTDASGSVTVSHGATLGDIITIISFKSSNTTTGVYASFTRNVVSLSNQSNYTCSGFTITNGNELLFLNGTIINAQDYNISGQTISFISAATGDLEVIQWSNNNLGVPNGTPVNSDIYTIVGQTIYLFSYDPNAFNLYNNGVLQLETVDYSVGTGQYTLSTSPTTTSNILVQQTFSRTGPV